MNVLYHTTRVMAMAICYVVPRLWAMLPVRAVTAKPRAKLHTTIRTAFTTNRLIVTVQGIRGRW